MPDHESFRFLGIGVLFGWFADKNRGRFLVYLVVQSSIRAIYSPKRTPARASDQKKQLPAVWRFPGEGGGAVLVVPGGIGSLVQVRPSVLVGKKARNGRVSPGVVFLAQRLHLDILRFGWPDCLRAFPNHN